jgi:hypothetical protein
MDVVPPLQTALERALDPDAGAMVAMSAQPMTFATRGDGRVLVADDVVYVRELDEADDEVVRVVTDADDPVAAVGQCLRVGARALRAAHVSVDVDVIERSFSELESRFGARVAGAVDEIAGASSRLLDPQDGALTGTLSSFHTEVSQLLGDTFDADSKSSVLARIEQLVLATMKGLIAPEVADSPIGRLKAELVDTVQREVGEIAQEVRRVTDHLGILEATDEVYQQTAVKGFDYEHLVDECVAVLAAGHGDLAEVTAKEPGSRASHVGDEVVTLNRDDSHGVEARFVLEMKNRPLNMRRTMAELDEALDNRDALAAIAVFRSQDQAPTAVQFAHFDDKAIVVFDPDDEDDSALRLAYMWARWTVRKGLAVSEEIELDVERVRCLLDDASRALERHTAIKRFHTQAKKSIDQAAEQVRDLVSEVHESLDALDAELRA